MATDQPFDVDALKKKIRAELKHELKLETSKSFDSKLETPKSLDSIFDVVALKKQLKEELKHELFAEIAKDLKREKRPVQEINVPEPLDAGFPVKLTPVEALKRQLKEELRREILSEIARDLTPKEKHVQEIKGPEPPAAVASPIKLPPAERQYYRDTWGFDPESDRIPFTQVKGSWIEYYYESKIELVNDSALRTAKVQFRARLYAGKFNESRNALIFRKGKREVRINCVNTIAYSGYPEEIAKLTAEELVILGQVPGRTLAKLPPWEHFAALKSFAQGLAEIGIFNLFDVEINRELVTQIIKELRYLVPNVVKSYIHKIAGDLLDRASPKWLIDRLSYLEESLGIHKVFLDPAFITSLGFAALHKLLKIYIYIKDHPLSYINDTGIDDTDIDERGFSISRIHLTPELIKPLEIPEKRALLLMVMDEIHWGQQDNLTKIAALLFRQLVLYGDPEAMKIGNLRKVLSKVEDPFEIGPPGNTFEKLVEQFQEIAPETLQRLLDAIFRFWTKYTEGKKPFGTILGLFPFQLISYFLKTVPDQDREQKLLKRAMETAPSHWLRQYMVYLDVWRHIGQYFNLEQEKGVQIPDFLQNTFNPCTKEQESIPRKIKRPSPKKQSDDPKDINDERRMLEIAIEQNPRAASAWINLMEFYMNVCRFDKTMETLMRAQDQDRRFFAYRICIPENYEMHEGYEFEEDFEDEEENENLEDFEEDFEDEEENDN